MKIANLIDPSEIPCGTPIDYSAVLIYMHYSLIALYREVEIRWGKPISVRFSRFNFENAWAYSWKQRWVFCQQASVEKFAVSDGEIDRLGFRTFIALWLVLADVFPSVESPNLSILPKLLGEATWQLLTYGEKEARSYRNWRWAAVTPFSLCDGEMTELRECGAGIK